MNAYRLFHRSKSVFKDIEATTAEEACQIEGWNIDDVWVRQNTSGKHGNGWKNITSREGGVSKKGGANLVTAAKAKTEDRKITYVDPESLEDNPFQPRHYYNSKDIDELAESIKIHDLRQIPEAREKDGKIQVAYGHKRKRAYIKLKKKNPKKWGTMPVEIKEISDEEMFYFAMEENLRRGDITPIDTARGIDRFLTTFPEKREQEVADKLKMTQGNVSNMRRVLRLPKEILDKVDEGKINFTMARELLIFQDIENAGTTQGRYSQKEQGCPTIIKDAKFLMLEACRKMSGQWGNPSTVDGMKKSIYSTAYDHLKPLEKDGSSYNSYRDPLFDTWSAGCLQCQYMLRVHPTKSQTKHYCFNIECWEKKQQDHKDEAARLAKEKMATDVLSKIGHLEEKRNTGENISQEISVLEESIAEDVDPEGQTSLEDCYRDRMIKETPEEDEEAEDLPAQRRPGHDLCLGCLNATKCDGSGVYTDIEDGHEICDTRVTKENFQEVTRQATIEIPEHLKEKVSAAAGTRAEILDLDQLRLGLYNCDLKAGHINLSTWLERMEDPEECTERCTTGFHYAYDSRKPTGEVGYVCTTPKCCSKKKAAFTRAKNARGQAKKKAELKAIEEAREQTTSIDRARLKLILLVQIKQIANRSSKPFDPVTWWSEKLGVEVNDINRYDGGDKAANRIIAASVKLSDEELAKAIVESMLLCLTYNGNVEDYKIKTTDPLNWMGVTPKIEKPNKETKVNK